MGHAAGAVPLMETKNLKKYFKVREGQLHAVDDVNIVIPERKTLGVVGESGCGKSTLGRTILRLLDASGGEVLYKGDNILRYGGRKMKEMRRKMQIIFQDPYSSINPRMSVAEIIAEFMIVHSTYPDKDPLFSGCRAYGHRPRGAMPMPIPTNSTEEGGRGSAARPGSIP